MASEPSFTVGIEEEYLLVDRETRDLVVDPPDELMTRCEQELAERVSPEFMQSQIEVGTSKCETVREAGAELAELRRCIARIAADYGLAPIGASTHPFAQWDAQKHTRKERYDELARDMQAVVRRLLICGMHVHVGLDDDELRIDLMQQISYFLPHMLALSTSSPFWRGEVTGLKCYRLSVFEELPRTGLPETFDSFGEYQRHLDVMISAGLIEDGTKIWWDVRPSARFPTLEMRVADVCTHLQDGITIAALYVSLMRMLYTLKRNNQRWRKYSSMLIQENRWRAQRYGFDEGLVDFGRGEVMPFCGLLDEIIGLVSEHASALDCLAEVEHAREIVKRGTSAHRQIAIYEAALAAGAGKHEALVQVVDFLIEETVPAEQR
ncbi:carboxylate-amine ligase [Pelagibius litoralis]|uniref:Putative glutamate--cysteine ligase 2 n=1 Tax=Pelagibius litoralis TaxID=374515 RepID=A0A967C5H1_9PROT|nr:carboxylate-amine ligase [Pelagibius litoralis]NIA69114.1 carboxylate-amine ligase [Pelagibius litoralis]